MVRPIPETAPSLVQFCEVSQVVWILTISTSSAQPVSNRMSPMCGCSIRAAAMIRSRHWFSGLLLLALLLLAPRRSLKHVRTNSHGSTRCSSGIVMVNIPPCIDPHRSQVQNVDLRTRRTEECWHTRPRENVRPAGHVADEISRSRFKRRDISHFQRNFAEGYNKRLRGKARRPFLKGPVFLAKGHVVSS